MPTYQYSAMDAQGKEKKGRIDADNENDANAKLKEQGLFPTSISKARGGGGDKKGGGKAKGKKKFKSSGLIIGTPKMGTKALCSFTRQLATLLDAGLPLVRALRTLERQTKDPGAGAVAEDAQNNS